MSPCRQGDAGLGGQDWIFWITAGAMVLAVTALLVAALLRGRVDGAPVAAYDLQVYRDQLAEVDRDLGRGVIGAEDAARLRTEVSRRVLDADRAMKAAQTGDAGPGAGRAAIALTVAITVIGTIAGYWQLGAPGYPDMPLQARIAMAEEARLTRPTQAEQEAKVPATPRTDADPNLLALMDKLRVAVAGRPDDLRGQELLARNEAGLGNYIAAYRAQAQVITIKADAATADDFATLAELQILAASGYVSPEAEKALTEALRRDAKNGLAQYYSGLMLAQIGRPDTAFQIWRGLLENSSVQDPWFAPLQAQIAGLASFAGVHYTPPGASTAPMMPGPGEADMAAAADMSDADRQAMIEGMVDQLSNRLATEGGTAQEWAQLITALGVLGRKEQAQEIYTEAKQRFAAQPDDLASLAEVATAAGLAP